MNARPISAADVGLLLIDLQEGIVNVGATADPQRLRAAIAALGAVATVFALPVTITGTATTGGTVAPLRAELETATPGAPVVIRTFADAFAEDAVRAAIEATRRPALIIAGIASEVAVALAAISAARSGLSVAIAVDACSGLDARTEASTFVDLAARGIRLTTVAALTAELAGDFTSAVGRAAIAAIEPLMRPRPHAHDRTDDVQNGFGSSNGAHEH